MNVLCIGFGKNLKSKNSQMFDFKKAPKRSIFKKNLNFREQGLEREFKKRKETYQLKLSWFILLAVVFISIFIFLLGKNKNNIKWIAFNCSKIFILLIFWLLKRQWPQKIEEIVVLTYLPLIIGVVLNILESLNIKGENALVYGMIIQCLSFLGMLLKLSWWKQIIILLAIQLTVISENLYQYPTNANIITSVSLFFGLSFLSFIIEKYERDIFVEYKKSEKSLHFFESFIRKALPLGVVILKNENILFNNKESVKLLGLENIKQLKFENLKRIRIKDEERSYTVSLTEKLILKYGPSMQDTAYDTLELRSERRKRREREFTNYKGTIQRESNKIQEFPMISIKINKIIWRDQVAVIILLAEDPDAMKLENLRQYEQYKNKILASVSHQLRTPLNGIMGILEEVGENIRDRNTRENLDHAFKSSQRLLALIDNIIDLGQMNIGNIVLDISEFYIEEEIAEVAKLIETEAKRLGLTFIIQNNSASNKSLQRKKEKLLFKSDAGRLRQILVNFLSNSLRFTKSGYIKLAFTIITNPITKSPIVDFSVEDTGSGMSQETIDTLFNTFGKVEISDFSELNTKGMGFGLAITHKLLECLNNKKTNEKCITIKSEVGRGSTFSFAIESLPIPMDSFINQDTDEKLISDERLDSNIQCHSFCALKRDLQREPDITFSKPTKRILVVDDDPVNIFVISRYLNTLPEFEYLCANDGLEALNLIKSEAINSKFFNMILMDCNMPVMDGFLATLEIIKLINHQEIPYVPIMAITANVLQTELNRCLDCGMVDYLKKPFSKEKLTEKINKFIV